MSASINTKTHSISREFFKRAAEHLSSEGRMYITSSMPVLTSTITESKKTLQELSASLSGVGDVANKMRQLKSQSIFSHITNWFTQKSENNDYADDLNFDVGGDFFGESDVGIEPQISEHTKNSNNVSKTIFDSSHKLVESQISATANIITAVEKQASIISAGFDKTNSLLSNMIEILSKNTSTLIEATVASGSIYQKSIKDGMVTNKFNLSNYKDMVKQNIENSPIGMAKTIMEMVISNGNIKDTILSMGTDLLTKQLAPKLEGNLRAIDNTISDLITGSLIRLGEQKDSSNLLTSTIAKLFGIDSTREVTNTYRSALEIKSVPFDSITKEAIVSATPGYLREILIALGGPDLTYDYSSRSFKSKAAIEKEFRKAAVSTIENSLYNSGDDIKNIIGTDKFSSTLYDLVMHDLSTKTANGDARKIISNFENLENTNNYMMDTILNGVTLTDKELSKVTKFSENIGIASQGFGAGKMMQNVASSNINRKNNMNAYVRNANDYNQDLSFIRDGADEDRKTLLASYGKDVNIPITDDNISAVAPMATGITGINYTNIALYEIYRRLNEGLNVFQIGKSNLRSSPFEKFGDDFLTRPEGYTPKQPTTSINRPENDETSSISDDENLLTNNNIEDGTEENLTKFERVVRWGKHRAGNISHAMFDGNSEQIKHEFGAIIKDIAEVGGIEVKKGILKINSSFGNISGYLKHKIFGSEYAYDTGEVDNEGKPKLKYIKENESGGMYGFIKNRIMDSFTSGKNKSMTWFKEVAGYFNYSSKNDDTDMSGKRKKLMAVSVGAMAGMGLIGGPMGLLFGAFAGNALEATGIGDRIKKMLFGEEYLDKNKKFVKKLGLVQRVVNTIVDPIKYQLGKTFHFFSKVMKKNVLGPLADIGFVIKETIVSTLSDTAKTVFGKFFNFIVGGLGKLAGGVIKGLSKGLLSVANLPINLAGGLSRSAIGTAGSVVGAGLNTTASLLALPNKDIRDKLQHRRETREAKIEEDYNEQYSGGQKRWKKYQDKRRRDIADEFRGATNEEEMSSSDIADFTKRTAESAETTARAVSRLEELGVGSGIVTRDIDLQHGIERLANNNTDNFPDSIVGAAGSIIGADGIASEEEQRLGINIVEIASRERPDKTSIISKFKNLMGIQSKRKLAEGEKEENIFQTLFSKFGGIVNLISDKWKSIAATLGILALVNKDVREAFKTVGEKLGDIGSNILESGKELFKWIKNGGDDKGDGTTKSGSGPIISMLTSALGIKVKNATDVLTPGAKLYHTQKDKDGNDIVHQTATTAKDAPYKYAGVKLINRMAGSIGYQMDANRYSTLAANADTSTPEGINAQRKQLKKAKKYQSRSDKYMKTPLGKNSTIGTNISSFGKGIAAGRAVGLASNFLTEQAALKAGMSEEGAAITGRVGELAGNLYGLQSGLKPDGYVNRFMNAIIGKVKEFLLWILKKLKKIPFFKKVIGKLDVLFKKILTKFTVKIMTPFMDPIIKIGKRFGFQLTVGALTIGVATATIAAAGAYEGLYSSSNLFGVREEDSDILMKTISTILGGLFSTPWGCLIDIIDLLCMHFLETGSFRSAVATITYDTINNDGGAELSAKRTTLTKDAEEYNLKNKTNLSKDAYNDLVNNMDTAHASKTNPTTYLAAESLDIDTVSKDEVDSSERNKHISDMFSGMWTKFTKPVVNFMANVTESEKKWNMSNFELDETGTPLVDSEGRKIFKQQIQNTIMSSLGRLNSFIISPVTASLTGAKEYMDTISPWAKEKFNSSKELIVDKLSNFYKLITDPINDLIAGVKEWFSNKTTWVKGGAKQWIKDKATSIEQMMSNRLFNNNSKPVGGQGGGLDELGIGKKLLMAPITSYTDKLPALNTDKSLIAPSKVKEKINPLNKEYTITSGFGHRYHPIDKEWKGHRGIDLAPSDGSGKAEVGATMPGTISSIEYQHDGAGNYVSYNTDDGRALTYMHLKDNSIPSNLKVGTKVKPGDKIGDMGNTGKSSGPHLHYQIEEQGHPVDPLSYLDGSQTMTGFNATAGGRRSSGSQSSNLSKAAGPLGALLSSLTEAGGTFLNKISGGLFGGTTNSSDGTGDISSYNNDGITKDDDSVTFNGLTGTTIPEKVYNFLREKGLNHESTIGILANLHQESNIDPTKKQLEGGPGRGIAQWEAGRLENLVAFCKEHGKDWTDLECQLEFLWQELTSSDINQRMIGTHKDHIGNLRDIGISGHPKGFEGFKTTKDMKYATGLFEATFERASVPKMQNRYAAIPDLDARLKNTYKPVGGQGGGLDEEITETPSVIAQSSENNIVGGQGGGLDEIYPQVTSGISSKLKNTLTNTMKKIFNNSTNDNDTMSSYKPMQYNSQSIVESNNKTNLETNNLQGVENALKHIITLLNSITNNTGESSSWLEALNSKDFVDVGMRNSISKLGQVKTNKPYIPFNHGNTKSINSMIKP